MFKGNSSNRFYEYSTNLENRLYNTPNPQQHNIQSNRSTSQIRKYNYLQG